MADEHRTELAAAVAASPLIAMLTEPDSPAVPVVTEELGKAGIRAVEITLTSPNALDAVRRSVATGATLVGAGTVRDRETARHAVDAGAHYLLTPGVLPDVLDEAGTLGVPVVCGAFTTTEVMEAWRLGAALVKLFPARLGGPAYLASLTMAFGDIPIVPTGGITADDLIDYFAAGAHAAALGRPLVGDALRGGNPADVRHRAADLLAQVHAARV
ncbi:bifunctional 4-hydroxy-2-oxoglutarate aldolase/2-dehydro-3-deoxy-phosphogluconate aldolase [Streptomyces sp. 4503]|uniref:Bifunctional 4-hydroxy-2-oxoglutarate aldolase/2-dehydro-3-deoxy-phosphogluconate aldolase n=1 Tax=Streptomyces niphimycinicus TaxID=2842201 RepID=A0ABS6CB14_9ACTN|nr:bifunctional 4-hydroxy-2-oxoglutarate aldolase/2-dehydro-3-deoxy-phosphogluconate aldolase [Streptomyces niphimycinicus]MBU3864079.1 bifunctional 4-hydroxy-2-oxoglutarate aldolase/2-dehydro-3-deoxy-phosphogluconate aldolase [Streptomyces niphimycinicus]